MKFRGLVLRTAIFNTGIVLEIVKDNINYKLLLPSSFESDIKIIRRFDQIILDGDFVVLKKQKIIYNETMSISIMKNTKESKYTLLCNIETGRRYNIFCYVAKYLGSIQTNGSDYLANIYVADESVEDVLKIQMFTSHKLKEDEFIQGDILKIENMKCITRDINKQMGLTDRKKEIIILGNFSNINEYDNLCSDEQEKVGKLEQHYRKNRSKNTATYQISDLNLNTIFDFVGIFKRAETINNNLTLCYFIDYTLNDQMQNEEKELSFLKIKMWDHFATEYEIMRENEIYYFKGIRCEKNDDEIYASLSTKSYGSITHITIDDPMAYFLRINKKFYYHKMLEKTTNRKIPELMFPYFDYNDIITNNHQGGAFINGYILDFVVLPNQLYKSNRYCKCQIYHRKDRTVCSLCQLKQLDGISLKIKGTSNIILFVTSNQINFDINLLREFKDKKTLTHILLFVEGEGYEKNFFLVEIVKSLTNH